MASTYCYFVLGNCAGYTQNDVLPALGESVIINPKFTPRFDTFEQLIEHLKGDRFVSEAVAKAKGISETDVEVLVSTFKESDFPLFCLVATGTSTNHGCCYTFVKKLPATFDKVAVSLAEELNCMCLFSTGDCKHCQKSLKFEDFFEVGKFFLCSNTMNNCGMHRQCLIQHLRFTHSFSCPFCKEQLRHIRGPLNSYYACSLKKENKKPIPLPRKPKIYTPPTERKHTFAEVMKLK